MEIPKEFLSYDTRTFQFQDSLPSLPEPSLEITLHKYLESVRPVLTDDEYKQTEFIVQQFGSGIGKTLHEKFIKKISNQRNWLEKLWEDKAYLEGRYPSAPLVNILGPGPYFHDLWPPKAGSQLERASIVLHTTVLFWNVLRKEQLRVDPAGKGAYACMNQYRRLFNTCKRPGLKKDTLSCYFLTELEGPCPHHVVVLRRGRFFKLTVVHPDGELLTPPELKVQLRTIMDICDKSPPAPGLGALTGDARTTWAENRSHLLSLHPSHAEHLEVIETAIVTFALDEREPGDIHKLVKEGIAGDSTCRWFDKSVTQVVFKNGTVISNCDHAPYDGIVYIYATHFSNQCIQLCGGKWRGSQKTRQMVPPNELVFHYDDKIRSAIEQAKVLFSAMRDNIETFNPTYKGYGKNFIRRFKLHPDAYVQMALQLAYYRMYRKPATTYETATLRRYWHGRTETLRSCTVEAIQWAKAMLDKTTPPEEKLLLFGEAMKRHLKNMLDATQLRGCDRHLLALSVLAEEEGLPRPTLFTDPAFKRSGGDANFILSTSLVGYTAVIGGCAPMCEHGYGVFYSIQPETLTFFLSAWQSDDDTSAQQMFASLSMSLNDMRQLIEEYGPKMAKM